jgi:hypothetical protein
MTLALISIQYPELAPDLHLHGLIVLISYIVILKVENDSCPMLPFALLGGGDDLLRLAVPQCTALGNLLLILEVLQTSKC